MTGGASSSSGPVVPVQEAAPVASPSSHEARMDESSDSTRPLEVDGGESSNKRARSLAGMLLFDGNDTSYWQDTVWEAQLTDAHDEHTTGDLMDQRVQPDTDVPGVWRCQIEPKSDLYGDKTGKLLDPEKVIKGRLTEFQNMNDHRVNDWIDEAEILMDEFTVVRPPVGLRVRGKLWFLMRHCMALGLPAGVLGNWLVKF